MCKKTGTIYRQLGSCGVTSRAQNAGYACGMRAKKMQMRTSEEKHTFAARNDVPFEGAFGSGKALLETGNGLRVKYLKGRTVRKEIHEKKD
ncbi:MAG TPA: hypothetical protein PLI34_18625 [Saprospiraceae bacterium]|nr:hypothetical protein [Saprospiraceae bacterium]